MTRGEPDGHGETEERGRLPCVVVRSGRDRALRRRHPWVLSGAISRVTGEPEAGAIVDVRTGSGEWLARGTWSPRSSIAVRVWTFDEDDALDAASLRRRVERAVARRREIVPDPDAPCRLVNAEADEQPGVIVDRYGAWAVCQFLSTGAERFREALVAALAEVVPLRGVYERSDAEVRSKEGLPSRSGTLLGDEPPELVEVREGPLRFLVDLRRGHKTGFYIDQRENRARLAEYAAGAEVLNAFAYTGGFGVAALAAGASRVTNVEASAPALELLQRNFARNGLDDSRVENLRGDAFRLLRQQIESGRRYDLIVLDPPRFADSRASLPRACRGYKDINLQAFRLLRPGGTLFTFSCSGHLGPELFHKVVADAALDAGRDAQVLRALGQPPDHPWTLHFPEGRYLKGLICRAR